jgi:hypothetical protein
VKRNPTIKRAKASPELQKLAKEKRISDSTLSVLASNGYTTVDDVRCIEEPDLAKLDIVLLAQKSLVRKLAAELSEKYEQEYGAFREGALEGTDICATSVSSVPPSPVTKEEQSSQTTQDTNQETYTETKRSVSSGPDDSIIQEVVRSDDGAGDGEEKKVKGDRDDGLRLRASKPNSTSQKDENDNEHDFKDFVSCGLAILEDLILDESSDSLAYCRHLSFCTIKAMSDSPVPSLVQYDNALRLKIERTGSSFPKRPDLDLCEQYLKGQFYFPSMAVGTGGAHKHRRESKPKQVSEKKRPSIIQQIIQKAPFELPSMPGQNKDKDEDEDENEPENENGNDRRKRSTIITIHKTDHPEEKKSKSKGRGKSKKAVIEYTIL